MNKIAGYQEVIEKQLQKLELPQEPKNLYAPIRYFLQIGGKRTRPSLTLLSCDLFGEPGIKAVNAALAIELFHNFTLIHDDIMDKAPLRRGQETVHKKWNQDIAILSGDVLYTEAYSLLLGYSPEITKKLLSVLVKVSREVCEGQQMDMDFEVSPSTNLSEYLEMIRLKTSVLLGAALEMGAIVAGVEDEKDLQNIYKFGENIGMAFQIQDDILDLYADPEKFGKQIGGDILSNKKTFLLLKAMEVADEKKKIELQNAMNNLTGIQKIEKIKSIFDFLKIRDFALETKQLYYEKALQFMKEIHVPEERKNTLLKLAHSLMNREF